MRPAARIGRCGLLLALLVGLASLPVPTASAQTLNSGVGQTPSRQISTAPRLAASGSDEPPLPAPEALFPSLFGARRWLADHGIAVLFDTVEEFDATVSGGGGPKPASPLSTSAGASLGGQTAVETDIDWEKLAGITGFSTNTVLVARYGGLPASGTVGDSLDPSSESYGAGGNVVMHLVQAYGEETVAHGRLQVLAGRLPLDDFFFASLLYCNYQGNALCGNPKNLQENHSHSTYPDSNWALRLFSLPLPDIYLQAGIYFTQSNIYNYARNFRSGFNFDTSYITGEAFPIEIGWVPHLTSQLLPGDYKIGFVYDNNPHPDDFTDIHGTAIAQTGLPAQTRKGTSSVYVLLDQMIVRNTRAPNGGVTVLGGWSHNDPNSSVREDQYFLGVQDAGFWRLRPFDQVNTLLTYQNVSGRFARTQEIELQEGIPPGEISGGASGVQKWTMTFELNYAIHAYRGVTVAPDFQYYIRPNAQANLPDAAFLGFKTHVEFF